MKAQTLLVLSTLSACGSDIHSENHDIGPLAVPSRADFPPVSDAMQLRCGTLDCHGQTGRNLRLFGHYGLRLAADADPVDPFTSTEEEYEASYRSIVSLEPETLSKVITKEVPVVELTFVRKARGLERHKGRQLMTTGDPLDRCLVGWLAGLLDGGVVAEDCMTVITTPKPEPDGGT